MTKQHLQTLIALAHRANKAGLIEINEYAFVMDAVNAAQAVLQTPENEQQQPVETEEPKAAKATKN